MRSCFVYIYNFFFDSTTVLSFIFQYFCLSSEVSCVNNIEAYSFTIGHSHRFCFVVDTNHWIKWVECAMNMHCILQKQRSKIVHNESEIWECLCHQNNKTARIIEIAISYPLVWRNFLEIYSKFICRMKTECWVVCAWYDKKIFLSIELVLFVLLQLVLCQSPRKLLLNLALK